MSRQWKTNVFATFGIIGIIGLYACSSTSTPAPGNNGASAATDSGKGTCIIGPAPIGQCPSACIDFGKFSVKADGVYDKDFCTGACDATTTCPDNYRCNGSVCVPACVTSADCPAFKSVPDCNKGNGTSVAFCQ